MTNDQQQVEAWRKIFEEANGCVNGIRYANGEYCYTTWEDNWQGFLLAKRNQPVIELPYPDHGDGFRYWTENEVDDAITAAGYSYRVRS